MTTEVPNLWTQVVEAQPVMLIKSGGAVGEGGLILLTRNSCCRFQWLVSVGVPHISEHQHRPVFHLPAPLPSSLFLSFPPIHHSFPGWCALSFIPAHIATDGNKTAVNGKKASLSCSYGLPEKVKQITWRHTSAQGDSTEVASFAKRSDPMIEPPYQGRVWLSTSLSDSQLTIQPVAIQDEGCYTCQYTMHAEGEKSSTVCLATYGKEKSFPRSHYWWVLGFSVAHTNKKVKENLTSSCSLMKWRTEGHEAGWKNWFTRFKSSVSQV